MECVSSKQLSLDFRLLDIPRHSAYFRAFPHGIEGNVRGVNYPTCLAQSHRGMAFARPSG